MTTHAIGQNEPAQRPDGLVVLGGTFALGERSQATYLEDMLPFSLKGLEEVVRCDPPLLLGARPLEQLRRFLELGVAPDRRVQPATAMARGSRRSASRVSLSA